MKDDEVERRAMQKKVDVEHRKRNWQGPKNIYHKDAGVKCCSEGSWAAWTFRAFRVEQLVLVSFAHVVGVSHQHISPTQ